MFRNILTFFSKFKPLKKLIFQEDCNNLSNGDGDVIQRRKFRGHGLPEDAPPKLCDIVPINHLLRFIDRNDRVEIHGNIDLYSNGYS